MHADRCFAVSSGKQGDCFVHGVKAALICVHLRASAVEILAGDSPNNGLDSRSTSVVAGMRGADSPAVEGSDAKMISG
jgi:hypothetical protein